nr:dhsB: succinate dehydrogenase and fumarate reductase iron-sulfur [uncultured bacterium]
MPSEELLKSDTIWYCGECMSCRPRCPRGNTPGYVIQALRTLSQKLGFFVESEKGRQQLALKRIIGENILRTGLLHRTAVGEARAAPRAGNRVAVDLR